MTRRIPAPVGGEALQISLPNKRRKHSRLDKAVLPQTTVEERQRADGAALTQERELLQG